MSVCEYARPIGSILEFDFSQERARAFERETKEHANWTEEALCVAWISGRNAADWEWWHGLPKYERERWLEEYRVGTEAVESGRQRKPAWVICARQDEAWKQAKALAAAWAEEIKQAFLYRKPCPIIPAPEYEYVLRMAFDLARVPTDCLVAAETDEDGKNPNHETCPGNGNS